MSCRNSARYLIELTSGPAEQRNFALAAQLCPELLGDDVERWDQWVSIFFAADQLPALEPFLPTDKPRLSSISCVYVYCANY